MCPVLTSGARALGVLVRPIRDTNVLGEGGASCLVGGRGATFGGSSWDRHQRRRASASGRSGSPVTTVRTLHARDVPRKSLTCAGMGGQT